MSSPRRLIFYVDGFNLYFGLRQSRYDRFFWLDIKALAVSILKANQALVSVKYFTSRVYGNPGKMARQNTYLEALGTLNDLHIFYGKYQQTPRKCSSCGVVDSVPSEKMTDVNIAVELLADAYEDAFDDAILVSADSDLVAPINAVKRLFPHKRVVVAFPPARASKELKKVADAYFTIGRANLAASQFPDGVKRSDGFVLHRPANWS